MSTSPVPKSGHPALLLVPGSGSSSSLDEPVGALKPFADLTLGLVSQGFAVLRLWKPSLRIAVKQWLTGTLTAEDEYIAAALAGLKFLRSCREIDPDGIFLLGHSLGARVAPRIALRAVDEGIKIRGLVCLATPARSLIDIMLAQSQWMQSIFPAPVGSSEEKCTLNQIADIRKSIELVNGLAGAEQDSEAEKHMPLETDIRTKADTKLPKTSWWKPWTWRRTPRYVPPGLPFTYLIDDLLHDPVGLFQTEAVASIPLLLMQGGEDFQVSPEDDFQRLKECLEARQATTFKSYDALNHCFMGGNKTLGLRQYDDKGNVDEQVVKDIVVWLRGLD